MGGGMGNMGSPPQGGGCVIIVSNLDEAVRFQLLRSLCFKARNNFWLSWLSLIV